MFLKYKYICDYGLYQCGTHSITYILIIKIFVLLNLQNIRNNIFWSLIMATDTVPSRLSYTHVRKLLFGKPKEQWRCMLLVLNFGYLWFCRINFGNFGKPRYFRFLYFCISLFRFFCDFYKCVLWTINNCYTFSQLIWWWS